MKFKVIQQRYTAGEIDPTMIARSDFDGYYSAAETMTNVKTFPQGGFRRADGLAMRDKVLKQLTRETSYSVTAPNGGTTANLVDDNIATTFVTTTAIGTTNPYVVAVLNLGSSKAIGKIEVRGLSLSSGSSSEFFLQTSPDNINWTTRGTALSVTATAKTYTRRVCASVQYVRLVRIGSTNLAGVTVTVQDMQLFIEGALSAVKLIPFVFNNDQTYELVFTDKNIAIYKDKNYVIDLRADDYTHSRIKQINATSLADTMVIFNPAVPTKSLVRGTADDLWTLSNVTWAFIPYYDFVPTTITVAATLTPSAVNGNINLTASVGSFTVNDVNQYIEGNSGRARITAFTSATVVKAVVEIPFADTTAISSGNWYILGGYEPAWSATRGYPATGTFHEGRLYIGGSRDRPTTLWGSRVDDYFDFDPGQILDDDGIEFTLGGDYNGITRIYSGRALMVFTAGGEYIVSQNFGEPITPLKMNLKRQSSIGSEPDLRTIELEGAVMYYQRGGQSIQEFIYDNTQDAYTNNIVSLISSHLVKNPVDIDARKATSTDQGAYLHIVRSDGTLSIGNILRSQKITSFVRRTTNGTFIACGVEDEISWFVVQRIINGETRYWLETFEESHISDASIRLTSNLPVGTMTGLSHLEGQTVKVYVDGFIDSSAAVVTNGSVTLNNNPTTSIEVGLAFDILVKDLPAENVKIGSTIGMTMGISEVSIRMRNTSDVVVNGTPIFFRGFGPAGGGSPLDFPPPQFTGIKNVKGFLGYDSTAQLTITQSEPMPIEILAVNKKVRVK